MADARSNRTWLITAVAAFCVAIAILHWRRAAEPHAVIEPPAPGPVNTHANAAGWIAPRSASQSPPASAAERQPAEAGGPLPLELSFHRRLAHLDRANRGRPSYVVDARLYNVSAVPLAVEVLVSSAASQRAATIELNVAPNGIADFGADDGLEMRAADLITLRSPPYRDLVAQIP